MATIQTTQAANSSFSATQTAIIKHNSSSKAKACGRATCSATCPLFKGCRKAAAQNN